MIVYPHKKPGKKRKKKPKNIVRDDKYLAFIRTETCIACWEYGCIPHHENLTGKGMGIKCSDLETIPLCYKCHDERHMLGKKSFSKKYNIDYAKEIRQLQNKFDQLK